MSQSARPGARTLVFVGTLTRDSPFYEPATGRGILVFALDAAEGSLQLLSLTQGTENPAYLAVDPDANGIYAVSEVAEWAEGVVTGYAVDPTSGALTYLNKQPTLGNLSTFAALDSRRRNLLVSNYGMLPIEVQPGKGLVVLPVMAGAVLAASGSAARTGSGPRVEQERSHPHCLIEMPDGTVAAADLGTDEVAFYDYDAVTGSIGPKPVETVAMPAGSGPRHLVCSGDGSRLYCVNEMGETIGVLARASQGVPYALVQLISTLPPGAPRGEAQRGSFSRRASDSCSPAIAVTTA